MLLIISPFGLQTLQAYLGTLKFISIIIFNYYVCMYAYGDQGQRITGRNLFFLLCGPNILNSDSQGWKQVIYTPEQCHQP